MANVYVYCNRRRSRPRIAIQVCVARCKHVNECEDYLKLAPINGGEREKPSKEAG